MVAENKSKIHAQTPAHVSRRALQRMLAQSVADTQEMGKIMQMALRDFGAISTIAKHELDKMHLILMPGTKSAINTLKAIYAKSAQYGGFSLKNRDFDGHGQPVVHDPATDIAKQVEFNKQVLKPIALELQNGGENSASEKVS